MTRQRDGAAVPLHTTLDGACGLPQWGVIRAQGVDAAAFLHGQLTQDVLKLGSDEARLAAYCSPKGRMLASFVVCRPAPETVLLACHESVLAPTLKRLSMFVLRAKCVLSDASGAVRLVGLAGRTAEAALGGAAGVWQTVATAGGSCLRLPDAAGVTRAWRIEDVGATATDVTAMAGATGRTGVTGVTEIDEIDEIDEITGDPTRATNTHPDANPPTLSSAAWRWLEVQSAVATIEAATADQFVPQMLNYEQIGGVNFQKGCYPGQEVVARSQYRGTAKRRAFLFDVTAPASAGDELFHSDDPSQPAGMIVNAAPWPTDADAATSVLAEVKLQSLEGGTLHLRASDGPVLRLQPLPYALTPA